MQFEDTFLEAAGIPIDYGFDVNRRSMRFLKLHGSMLWSKCANCGEVHRSQFLPIIGSMRARRAAYLTVSSNASVLNALQCICEKPSREFLIVPPSWSKATYHHQLRQVWKAAAAELKDARNIFVIGYSLPESDSFFRFLYALGTIGDQWLETFAVFDPNISAAESRFKSLLGQSALERFRPVGDAFDENVVVKIEHILQRVGAMP